jgi:hypothetical protein
MKKVILLGFLFVGQFALSYSDEEKAAAEAVFVDTLEEFERKVLEKSTEELYQDRQSFQLDRMGFSGELNENNEEKFAADLDCIADRSALVEAEITKREAAQQ